MPPSTVSASAAPESPALSAEGVLVRDGLAGRRKVSSPAEERRLVKTLERLAPAANVAMAGVSTDGALPAASPDFSAVLRALSHA